MEAIKFLKGNECPECGGELILRDIEILEITLDKNGIAKDFNNGESSTELALVCKKCNRGYDVKKNGLYHTIDTGLTDIKKVIKVDNPFVK